MKELTKNCNSLSYCRLCVCVKFSVFSIVVVYSYDCSLYTVVFFLLTGHTIKLSFDFQTVPSDYIWFTWKNKTYLKLASLILLVNMTFIICIDKVKIKDKTAD